jgi:hypothetical protein
MNLQIYLSWIFVILTFVIALLGTRNCSAQQCVEPGVGAPPLPFFDPFGVLTEEKEEKEEEPEEEYFEEIGDGWTAGSTKGGKRIGTWWHWQDKDNWKKVTYEDGQIVFWQKLVAGRRLFEFNYNYDVIDWHIPQLKVLELSWNKDRTLDWKEVDHIRGWHYINEHGHFNNQDGTPSKRRTHFGDKYKYGDEFEETIMGVPLK